MIAHDRLCKIITAMITTERELILNVTITMINTTTHTTSVADDLALAQFMSDSKIDAGKIDSLTITDSGLDHDARLDTEFDLAFMIMSARYDSDQDHFEAQMHKINVF